MYVACSTSCFARHPLDRALRIIGELEFSKVDVAIHEDSTHLKPSEVLQDVNAASQQIRIGPSLTPGAFSVDFSTPDPKEYQDQLKAICRLARMSTVSIITLSASPNTMPFEAEVARLKPMVRMAEREGITITLLTKTGTLTELPETAARLCEEVPGLGLTLDPSHFLIGPCQGKSYDEVFPFVRHVHLRDTGRGAEQFQVRIGQGQIEYGKIISHLNRCKFNRLLTVAIHDIPDAPFSMTSEVRKLKYLLESLVY